YSWQLEEACNHNPVLSDKWSFYPYLLEQEGYVIGYTGKGWGPGTWSGYDASRSKGKANPAGYPWNEKTAKPPYKGMSNTDYAANFEAFLQALTDEEGDEAKPFCFWFGTKEPHRGYGLDNWKLDGRNLDDVTVPAYYPDHETIRGDLADYAIEVEWYDDHIQRALAHLEAVGKLDNTLIIATSDHGMPFPRVKGQIYDDGFHIPFAVRWGEKIKPGRTVTDFITFPDLAPTLLEIAGVERHEQMTGASFLSQLLAETSGRIDAERNYTLLGKERHDIGRTDGDLRSVAYPSRAIRTDRFLYVRNFQPHRWPVGDPEFGFKNCDGSPTKTYLTGLTEDHPDYRYFEMSFGKRPEEELYDIINDPDCVHNLAANPERSQTLADLSHQLTEALQAQGDPRILGQGEIFDYYPYSKMNKEQELYQDPDYDSVSVFEEKFGD
ncbi:MAG: sulfatase, partial [Verrucomicrobiota bacterium]